MSLSHHALATPVAGQAQCTLPRSPVVRCFLRHIGAAGFRVKWALCQECVRLGWVVFQRTQGSRHSPLPSPYRSCSDETRLTTNWILRNWGEKGMYSRYVGVQGWGVTDYMSSVTCKGLRKTGNCNPLRYSKEYCN